MSGTQAVWAVFDTGVAAAAAIRALRQQGKEFTLYAPFMTHDLEHAIDGRGSSVRLFVLIGGLVGLISGFALAAWTALHWGLIVGGKPIVAFPPFLVIGFELTLLFGALAALLGLLILGGLPSLRRSPGYDAACSVDHFGVCVNASGPELEASRRTLEASGAIEIRDVDERPGEVREVNDA